MTLVAHEPAIAIGAGGIVPVGAKLPADQRTSPVTARAYTHPTIEGRTIVRLEPDAVAAGVDAEMAAFGFEASSVSPSLGLVRYRTLGFPAWALIHEPKKAKAALDVTDAFRQAKRLVAAKPGHAKEAFEKIAKQLQRTAPQFLPSFWEEAGRVVADQASSTMAAQCFERARQAERAYKLKTSAEDSDAVFVEFALLGALSAKTLSAYAKELAKSAGGKEAYRRFRAIIIKRALGGMPPYSGMGKDLRALAQAAGARLEAEEDLLVSELVDAPGVGKAPVEFWTTYRDALVRIAKATPEIRARLRAIWPVPRGGSDETKLAFKGTWLALLGEVGALDDVTDQGLGAWVSRLVKYAGDQPAITDAVRGFVPRLAKLDQAIDVTVDSGWDEAMSIDLAELALAEGVRLVDPAEHARFSMLWITVDPVRVAADARYGRKLVDLVARHTGDKEWEPKFAGKQGFVAARRAWIEAQLASFEAEALHACGQTIDVLENKTTAETFLPFPELHARLSQIDLAGALAAQLRAGIVDELGWPGYESAIASLGDTVQLGGAFPTLCAWNATKAIAFGKDGPIAEHDLVYKPKDHKVESVMYLDGQFLVVLDPRSGWQTVAYWSGSPKRRFEIEDRLTPWGGDCATAWTTPDGEVTLGERPFRAGDAPTGLRAFVATGQAIWPLTDHRWKPMVGEGTPPFVGDWAPREGWSIQHDRCVLLPAPEGLVASPLGLRDGLLGLRVRERDQRDDDDWSDEPEECERIDGVTWTGMQEPFALLVLPGDPAPRPLQTASAKNQRFLGATGPGTEIYSTAGEHLSTVNEHAWAAQGWGVLVPPAAFWDYLTPRDPAGSEALRGISVDAARVILEAARTDDATLARTRAAVRSVRPAICDAKLVHGIAGIAAYAAQLANRLAGIAAERAKEFADTAGATLSGDALLVRKLATALATGRASKIEDFDVDVGKWLKHGRAHAALARSPLATDAERRAARDMVRALAGFGDDLSHMRLLEISEPDDFDSDDDWNTLVIQPRDGSIFAIHDSNNWALEVSTDGTFRVPAPYTIANETRLSRGLGAAWTEAYLALPDERTAWDPVIAARIAERADLSIAEATLLYTGAPDRDAYSKDFLGKQRRELVGLKMGDADAARTLFRDLPDDKLYGVIAAAVPDDPAELATPAFADRLSDAWRAKHGKRVKIPQDLVTLAKKELETDDEFGAVLTAFAGDDDQWFLKADHRPYADLNSWDQRGLFAAKARELATFIGWLFLQRPVGDPIRASIPRIVATLRGILDDPRTMWTFDSLYVEDADPKGKARRRQLLDFVNGKPFDASNAEQTALETRDDGTLLVALYESTATAAFRTAKLTGRGTERAKQLANLFVDPDDEYSDPPILDVDTALLLRSDGFAALADRVAETDVPVGQYEANPLHSARKLVARVVREHGISEDAAVLYLQTLALAEPTQAKVTLWNGWKPKQYAAAGAELVKKKLVTEGKRERAGRSLFVKGGYAKGRGKNLPMEEWKQPFYALLSRHVITEPPHLLFARAYKRIADGDKP